MVVYKTNARGQFPEKIANEVKLPPRVIALLGGYQEGMPRLFAALWPTFELIKMTPAHESAAKRPSFLEWMLWALTNSHVANCEIA